MLRVCYAKATLSGYWVSLSEPAANILFLFPFFPGKQESLV